MRASRNRSSAHLYFYWFRCTIQFWNSLHPILKKLCRLTFLFANRVAIRGLIRFYVHSKTSLRLSNFWMPHDLVSLSIWNSSSSLCIIGSWRELDSLTPHMTHHSSRIMRTHHTQFGVPLGIAPGWWDDRKRNHKPMLPIYLRPWIFQPLSRALSCLRLSGHNFLVQTMPRHNSNIRPYELRICDKCDWHSVQDEKHILLDIWR